MCIKELLGHCNGDNCRHGLAISSAQEGKSGSIYMIKS